MKVNDLIELLEYCDAQAQVRIGLADNRGRVAVHKAPTLLVRDDEVILIVDRPQESGEAAGDTASLLALEGYVRPQLFGKRLLHVPRRPTASPNG